MTNKVVLFLDNDFLVNVWGEDVGNVDRFNRILNALAQKYDIRITDFVEREAVARLPDGSVNLAYPKDVAVDAWLTQNNITPIETSVSPGTSNGGEMSIIDAIKNSPALYDSEAGMVRVGTFDIASNDASFANSGHPDAALFESNRSGTQSLVEAATVRGDVSYADYKTLSMEGSPSIGGWRPHQQVAAEVISTKTGVPTTWDVAGGNFIQDVDGNPENLRHIPEGEILKSAGSYSNIGEFLGAAGAEAEAISSSLSQKVTAAIGGTSEALAKVGLAAMALDVIYSSYRSYEQATEGDTLEASKTLAALSGRVALGIAGAELGVGIAGAMAGLGLFAATGPVAAGAALIGGLALGVGGVILGDYLGNILGGPLHEALQSIAGALNGVGEFIGEMGIVLSNGLLHLFAQDDSGMNALPAWYGNFQTWFNVDVSNTWDPLVVDLDGDGVNADITQDRVVYFDLDTDGLAEAINWVKADDGILVRDVNGNGKIDDGSEVFGNAAVNGFDALRTLDGNADGKITAADAVFSSLKIWQDLNQDGISETGELQTLSTYGITGIDTANYTAATVTTNGVTHVSTATTTDSATTLEIANVALRTDARNTHYMKDYDLDLRALFLPTLHGYGKVADLHVALSLDNGAAGTTLMSQAIHLVSYGRDEMFTNWQTVGSEFRGFLFNWAGVEGIATASRGTFVDAQELTFLENYFGSGFINENFDGYGQVNDPGSQQGLSIHALFEQVSNRLLGNFLSQTSLMQMFDGTGAYSLESDSLVMPGPKQLSAQILDEMAQYAAALPDTAARQAYWLGVADFISSIGATAGGALDAASEGLLDMAIHASDLSLGWYTESHDPQNGLTSIEYRYANPLGETITGTSGNDTSLTGSDFEDTIIGGAGADTIYGGGLADRIFGHTEDGVGDDGASDTLYGGDGDDFLDGGAGNDFLYGEAGNDLLVGGEGNDYLNGGWSGQKLLQGGGGNDTFVNHGTSGTNAAYEYIEGGIGTDTVLVSGVVNYMSDFQLTRWGNSALGFYAGNGSAYTQFYITDQFGSENSDAGVEYFQIDGFYNTELVDIKAYLAAYTGSITTYGSDGADEIHGVTLGNPNDLIYAKKGDDVIYGDGGNDIVYGGDGDDEIHGGAGNDSLRGEAGYNVIYGDEGDDYISSSGGSILYGGIGNDELAASGNAVLYGDDGNDLLYLSNSTSGGAAYGGDGSDTLIGGTGNDVLVGGAGDDTLNGGQSGADTASYLDAPNGVTVDLSLGYADALNMGHDTFISIENLSGSLFDDHLIGSGSTDILSGNSGNDILDGAAGNDTLYGDLGADQIFGGSGRDVLYGGDGDDLLDGGTGDDSFHGEFGADSVVYNTNGSQFIIYRDNLDYLTIMNTGDTTATGYGTDKIYGDVETITFNDLVLDLKDGSLDTIGSIWGTTVINGTSASETIYGFIGRDIVYAGDGGDTVYGREQTDILYGGTGNDIIYGEAGDDVVYGEAGTDTLYGGDGVDIITGAEGDDQLYGDAGDDTLEGGLGTDNIHGGDGVDTVVLNTNSMNFIIYRNASTYVVVQDTANTGATGFGKDRIYDDVEQVQFNDVTLDLRTMTFVMNEVGWGIAAPINGTTGNDVINGYLAPNLIDGGSGNDTIYGNVGNDVIRGAEGADSIYGNGGDDSLEGGSGTDTIQGGDGVDTVILNTNSTNFIIYRNNVDYITVQDTGNTTTAGFGTDKIYNDVELVQFNDVTFDLRTMTFVMNEVGWGAPAPIYGTAANNALSGYQANDVIYGYGGNDSISGDAGVDTIYGGDGNDVIHGYRMSGGVDDGAGDILYGEVGDDTLHGNGGGDLLYGGDGQDTLNGGDGDDTLEGGVGNDTLSGGNGNDVIRGAEGADSIYGNGGDDSLEGGSGTDTIQGGDGVDTVILNTNSTNFIIYRNNVDYITVQDTGNTTTAGFGTDKIYNDVELVQFNDVTFDLRTMTFVMNGMGWGIPAPINGTTGNDIINGYLAPNVIDGGSGNDTIYGNVGNDVIRGGAGTDTIRGEAGNDTLFGDSDGDTVYGGDGDDYIEGGSGNDLIYGEAGVDTVSYSNATASVTFDLSKTTSQVTGGAGTDTVTGVENIVGSAYNDTITGNLGDNIIEGGSGNDVLNAGGGIDTASYRSAASGVIVDLSNATAQNTVGAGEDTLTNFENLIGSDYDDILIGNAEDNSLIGNAGDDTLSGGLGSDTLNGGAGVDTVSYATSVVGVSVSLSLETPQDTVGSGIDTILGVENLVGSEFDDVLSGNSETNVLDGKGGSDLLYLESSGDMAIGGIGVDTFTSLFRFGVSYTISDFDSSQEIVVLDSGVDGYNAVRQQSFDDLVLTQDGNDTLVSRGFGDTIRLVNTQAADLTSANFSFISSAASPVGDISLQQGIPDASVEVNGAISIDLSSYFLDENGDELSYQVMLSDGRALPSWLSVDQSTGILSGVPLEGDLGALSISVLADDGDSQSLAGDIFTLNVVEPENNVIDFSASVFSSYSGEQDAGGTISLIEDGAGVVLQGNAWKKMDFDYLVTKNSVLTFEYKSDLIGELQGIALEKDNDFATGAPVFKLYGTQVEPRFNQDYSYNGSGDWQTFSINVGSYTTGHIEFLSFVNDNDAAPEASNSYFRNITISEEALLPTDGTGILSFSPEGFSSYSGDQDAGGALSLIENGQGVQLEGNVWKKSAIDYSVTANTILSFDFMSTAQGELQAISLDTDDSFLTGIRAFKLYGTQMDSHFSQDYSYNSLGGWQHFEINVGAYTSGQVNFLSFINDYDAISGDADSLFKNIKLYEGGALPTDTGVLDFSFRTISGYSGDQDAMGAASLIEGSTGVQLDGNAWKKVVLDCFVADNTVLSFDFKSTAQGEIQGISLDTDDDFLTGAKSFKLYGTQTDSHFNQDYTYNGSGDWQHFDIKIGDYISGNANFLSFINDDDESPVDSSSMFRNIRIYDAVEPTIGVPVIFQQGNTTSYSVGQDATGTVGIIDGGSGVSLTGNLWKKIDLDYSVSTKTVLAFEYRSSVKGEIQGIGLDFDNNFQTGSQLFKLQGTQGDTHFNESYSYNGAGDWQGFTINVGDHQTGEVNYLALINDQDIASPTAKSEFRNIRLYEDPLITLYDTNTAVDGAVDGFAVHHTVTAGTVLGIENFNAEEGDYLDLSSLLEQYDSVTESISDFVSSREVNGHTRVYVDRDGAGEENHMELVAQINNTTDLGSPENMIQNSNILV
jgi:Ca2+-binding RTX toxin-like protein